MCNREDQMPLDDLTIVRALHVVAVVHWIGGVSMVTLVILPGLIRSVPPVERLRIFEAIEGRFVRLRFVVLSAPTFEWTLPKFIVAARRGDA